MASERLITSAGAILFSLIAIILWQDYLSHSAVVYGDRDAIQSQIAAIDVQIANETDGERIIALGNDRSGLEVVLGQANRRINDMDGWGSLEWKVKNSFRFATPAVAVLFAGFAMLSIFHPMK